MIAHSDKLIAVKSEADQELDFFLEELSDSNGQPLQVMPSVGDTVKCHAESEEWGQLEESAIGFEGVVTLIHSL